MSVRETIEAIEKPERLSDVPNLRRLSGSKSFYRVRVGNLRIGLAVEDDTVESCGACIVATSTGTFRSRESDSLPSYRPERAGPRSDLLIIPLHRAKWNSARRAGMLGLRPEGQVGSAELESRTRLARMFAPRQTGVAPEV